MAAPADIPRVIAPPPLIALAAVVAGILLDWLVPVYVLATLLTRGERIALASLLGISGVALAVAARQQFVAAGTNVNPWKPSLHLAASGVYQYLRNPMYAGLLLLAGGIGVGLASDWTLVLLVPAALLLHRGVVLREERYLEARFGDEYRRYKATVARWGVW